MGWEKEKFKMKNEKLKIKRVITILTRFGCICKEKDLMSSNIGNVFENAKYYSVFISGLSSDIFLIHYISQVNKRRHQNTAGSYIAIGPDEKKKDDQVGDHT